VLQGALVDLVLRDLLEPPELPDREEVLESQARRVLRVLEQWELLESLELPVQQVP